jgi:dipeptidyl aminopeptidase/acylaminoacyl peptidase
VGFWEVSLPRSVSIDISNIPQADPVRSQTYQLLSDKSAVVVYLQYGRHGVIHVDLETHEWTSLDIGLVNITWDSLQRLSPTSFLVLGSGAKTQGALYRVDLDAAHRPTATVVRTSSTTTFDQSLFSAAQHIELDSKKGPPRDIHAFYWPPHNPRFIGPEGKLPPLIINSHGGPSSCSNSGLSLRIQYWTSRGYGYAALNYTGSTGHGKPYRERLFRQWGILDRDDAAELIRHMSEGPEPLINAKAVGIEGGSAGGYHTLQSLVWYPELFAAGIDCYGISDAKTLAAETHKFESRYCDVLFFGKEGDRGDDGPPTEDEKEALFYERSPIKHAERMTSPLLIMHGEDDHVVPVNQAYEMEKKVLSGGGEVRFVLFKGEGHGWKKDESWVRHYQESEAWWKKTLAKRANEA